MFVPAFLMFVSLIFSLNAEFTFNPFNFTDSDTNVCKTEHNTTSTSTTTGFPAKIAFTRKRYDTFDVDSDALVILYWCCAGFEPVEIGEAVKCLAVDSSTSRVYFGLPLNDLDYWLPFVFGSLLTVCLILVLALLICFCKNKTEQRKIRNQNLSFINDANNVSYFKSNDQFCGSPKKVFTRSVPKSRPNGYLVDGNGIPIPGMYEEIPYFNPGVDYLNPKSFDSHHFA